MPSPETAASPETGANRTDVWWEVLWYIPVEREARSSGPLKSLADAESWLGAYVPFFCGYRIVRIAQETLVEAVR